MNLLAIDIGTSGPKAAIFAPGGLVLCSADGEYPPQENRPGRHELDPQLFWKTLTGVLQKLPEEARACVGTASISSHGESFLPIGRNGESLGPFIMNIDNRAIQEAHEFTERFGREYLYQVTGLPAHTMYPLPKILWLMHHQPEIFSNTARFLCIEDYILHRIGVGAYISFSLASRTFGFDLERREWSQALLGFAGISTDQLSVPTASGTDLGEASAAVMTELGLPHDTHWVIGGHDQACCSLGGGGMLESVAVDGMGTFECISVSHGKPILSPIALAGNLPSQHHVLPRRFITLAYAPAGIIPSWLRSVTARHERESYSSLFANLPAEPTGLFFLPYLVGTGTPWLDAQARGAIIGLSNKTTKHDLYKGGLEGITYEMLWNLELLMQAGIPLSRIHAVGGGTRSAEWLQIKADIFGREIVAVAGEASCTGAAICAGAGRGVFSSWQEGADIFVREQKSYMPNEARHTRYREYFEHYKSLVEKLYGYRIVVAGRR